MPVSIITIDVQDEAFKEFQSLFLKYQSQVDAMPSAWAKVGQQVKKSSNPFTQISKIVKDTGEEIKKAATYQEKFKAGASGTGKAFGVIATSAKAVFGHIKNATLQLLKWSGLASVFTGLLGAGGLMGIGRLAQSAANSRRESQGLGVTVGEHKAAKINFSKFVDVDSMLERINDARNDVTKRWAFSAAGLPQSQMEGKSNAEVMKLLIPLLKSTNERAGGTLQGAQAHGLTEFADMSTLTRLKAMQQQEIEAAMASYDKDRQALAVADQTLSAWQTLDAQLTRAGVAIENIFVKKLESLTGPLTHLSEAFTRAVKTFLDSPKIGQWIGDLGRGIERFAQYLSGDEFDKDVAGFLDAIDTFTGALYSAGKTLGKVLGLGSEKTLKASEYRKLDELEKLDPNLAKRVREKMESPNATKEQLFSYRSGQGGRTRQQADYDEMKAALAGPNGAKIDSIVKSLGQVAQKPWGQTASGKIIPLEGSAAKEVSKPSQPVSDFYKALEKKHKLQDGLLSAVEYVESRGNEKAVGPVTKNGQQAQGPFQFMPATAKMYGVNDPHNRQEAAPAAAEMLHDLLDKYRGDLNKALAAYNWGSGNLDKKGIEAAPRETKEYVKSVTARMPAMGRTEIMINNSTGGNAVVIANQIAQ